MPKSAVFIDTFGLSKTLSNPFLVKSCSSEKRFFRKFSVIFGIYVKYFLQATRFDKENDKLFFQLFWTSRTQKSYPIVTSFFPETKK